MKRNLLIIILSHWYLLAIAQSFKDTLHLQDVNIYASLSQIKDKSFDAGKKIQYADSILQQVFSSNTLSDLLNYQTSVFIKNYAPGGIGSISIRGGNAQQTAVLWNGININHPMLGQTDFSQYTSGLFDNISIEYGGSSSLWGNAAMSGSVRLNNTFSNQNFLRLKYRTGSFHTNQFNLNAQIHQKKLSAYLNGNYVFSQNNYFIGDSIQLQNAHYILKDVQTGISYKFNSHHQLNWHFWVHSGINHIPNNYFYNTRSALQTMNNYRSVLDYVYEKSSWKMGVKTAYLLDDLNYTDSVSRIFSNSKVHTFQSEENIYKQINSSLLVMIGHQLVYHYAITNNYINNTYIIRNGLFAGIYQGIKKFKYNIIVRKEWANIQSEIPITGNIGAEYFIQKNISLKSQIATTYRLPTMNDLYWKGNGDIHLLPESGYSADGSILIKIPFQQKFLFQTELSAFYRITNNWIIWLPGGSGQPVPKNIAQVFSRGTETNNSLTFKSQTFKFKMAVSSAYILSTVQKSNIINDASLGKQLIYTPRYNINGFLHTQYKNIFLVFTHQYIGYRFIASDNTQWLNPYHISNVSVGYNFSHQKFSTQILLGVNNLFNTSYMIIPQRPMPLRNYFVQINLQINKINNPKNQTL